MRKYVGLIAAVLLFALLTFALFTSTATVDPSDSDAKYYDPVNDRNTNATVPDSYLTGSRNDTGSQNVVTAIVVEYRGFDTLGEVTVLFSAATGLAMILSFNRRNRKNAAEPNFIVATGSTVVLPFIILVGAYIFIHGHLSPGGGFPGGAVIASGFLLMLLAYPNYVMKKGPVTVTESLAGLTFVTIALLGLVFASAFLQNFLDMGDFGTLLSAGIIPLIYIAVGFKVGSELSAIMGHMKGVDNDGQ